MSPELLSLLTQAPPIAIVIVAGFYFLKEMNKRDAALLDEINKRDQVWREFIREISEGQSEMTSEMVRSIKEAADVNKTVLEKMTVQLARNTATILLHDATVRGADPTKVFGTTDDLVKRILE